MAPDSITTGEFAEQILSVSPAQEARQAGLRYVSGHVPGIRRRRVGQFFSYRDRHGTIVKDPLTLDRIRKLAVPPAWRDVWICAAANGHLQATGADASGRKQYRYHSRWREVRDESKYDRVLDFGRALPRIRAKVECDLRREGLPREKILATIVRLLETTLIRVGNREYAEENGSYGLTTLRNRHIAVNGDTVHFEFRAKSGKMRKLDLKDRRLAGIMRRCRDLPGQELFQYVDPSGARHGVASDDVNAYLREAAGGEFTAKDFRTWAGTVLAASTILESGSFDSEAGAKRNIASAIETVAARLGNTAAICRKCYIHPQIFEAYLDGTLLQGLAPKPGVKPNEASERLAPEEIAVLNFLRQRLGRGSE